MKEMYGRRRLFKEYILYGRRRWNNGFGMNESEQPYLRVKSQPKMRTMQMWER